MVVGLLKIALPTAIVLGVLVKFPVAIVPVVVIFALLVWHEASRAKTMPVTDYDRNND